MIRYREDGQVDSDDKNIRRELVDDSLVHPKHYSLLNLNHQSLIDARYAAWGVVKRELTNLAKGGDWRLQDIKDYVEKFKKRDSEGRFKEFCCFVLYRLEKKLK